MTGHLKTNLEVLNQISWADLDIDQIRFEYDFVELKMQTDDCAKKCVRLYGQISFEVTGFWDEMIVESIELFDDHPRITENLARLNRNELRDSGSPWRNSREWLLLELKLIDGCSFFVVFNHSEIIETE